LKTALLGLTAKEISQRLKMKFEKLKDRSNNTIQTDERQFFCPVRVKTTKEKEMPSRTGRKTKTRGGLDKQAGRGDPKKDRVTYKGRMAATFKGAP